MSKTRSVMGGIFAVVALTLSGGGVATASLPPVTLEQCRKGGGDAVRDGQNTIIDPGEYDFDGAWCRGGTKHGREIAR
ncbi:hypothetical protein ACFWPX_29585 [Nocardia sp. NPDC058518]|uniref:hypothetical protein n=1 Tax=Nocardia sp. NPDC058518 TaxID=3346534 RepID=UPI0036562C33